MWRTHRTTQFCPEHVTKQPLGCLDLRLEGIDAVCQHLAAVQAAGPTVGDVTVQPAGSGTFLAEYSGNYRTLDERTFDVPMTSVIGFDGTRVRRIREYWDSLLVASEGLVNKHP